MIARQNKMLAAESARFCSRFFSRIFMSKLPLVIALFARFRFARNPIAAGLAVHFAAQKIFPARACKQSDRRDDEVIKECQQNRGNDRSEKKTYRHPTQINAPQPARIQGSEQNQE